jgi:hypothetical protein
MSASEVFSKCLTKSRIVVVWAGSWSGEGLRTAGSTTTDVRLAVIVVADLAAASARGGGWGEGAAGLARWRDSR